MFTYWDSNESYSEPVANKIASHYISGTLWVIDLNIDLFSLCMSHDVNKNSNPYFDKDCRGKPAYKLFIPDSFLIN